MATVLADNAFGTLASGLAVGGTTLTFTTGHGARFPTITGSDVCYVCILNSSNVLEEVIITAHAAGADTATITRAAGSTTAKVWVAGDRVEARISKTALQAAFAAIAGSASQAFSALAVNTGLTSVASAATPDIFAATTGQYIYYTGTATCTGFVAAPHAGIFRKLICADACSFTASANLLIEGIPSGTTITLGNSALIEIWASSTTQFKMTYSLSGTFTATGTGFTANPTVTAIYKVENGWVSLFIPTLQATSNSTAFTITGAPACITASVTYRPIGLYNALDNGAECVAVVDVNGGATIQVYKTTFSGGSWTASGTKALRSISLSYPLAG